MLNKFLILKIILFFGLLDIFSVMLLILFYLTGIDIVFLVNINFLMIYSFLIIGCFANIKINNQVKFFLLLFLISFLKLFSITLFEVNIEVYFIFTYFYSLVLSLVSFIFVSRFEQNDYEKVLRIFKKFAYYYLSFAAVFLSIYSILYFSGKISYFGMGANLHLVLPFFMKKGYPIFILFLVVIILSGKRAVLLNFMVQYFVFYMDYLKNKKSTLIILFLLIASSLILLNDTTDVFSRFKATINVDFSDKYSTIVAFGGRYQEILGVYDFFNEYENKLIFGSIPGEYYNFNLESSITDSYHIFKNYTHVTLISFLFRYGFVFTSIIIIYVLYNLIKYFNPRNEFYLIFLGITTSSFFGANLLTEPISWILIAFFAKYKNIKYEN